MTRKLSYQAQHPPCGARHLREKLIKDQSEAFIKLDADGKAQWLADNPRPAVGQEKAPTAKTAGAKTLE